VADKMNWIWGKAIGWWRPVKARLARLATGKWSFSVSVFTACLIIAFGLTLWFFPPEEVKTPFGFVLAYSVFVGMLSGLGALLIESASFVERDLNRKDGDGKHGSTHWKTHRAYTVYVGITLCAPILAFVCILLPIKNFDAANVAIPISDLGKSAKTGMLKTNISGEVKHAIENIEDEEFGRHIAVVINETNHKYIKAIHLLEIAAFSVVVCYFLADFVGWRYGEEKTFRVMIVADMCIITVHGLSTVVILYSEALWFFRNFNATMIQSFCGGLMGFSLLAQCALFGYILPLSSQPDSSIETKLVPVIPPQLPAGRSSRRVPRRSGQSR
jgi:hypothetical protein